MIVTLQKIPPKPFAMTLAALHGVIGAIVGILAAISSVFGDPDTSGLGIWSPFVFPILNSLFGFLSGLFIAWAYNLLTRWTGGMQLEFNTPPGGR